MVPVILTEDEVQDIDTMEDFRMAEIKFRRLQELKAAQAAANAETFDDDSLPTPYYRIDTNLIRCDYLSFLETGKPGFYGEYMTQYSWAEETCAMLQFQK